MASRIRSREALGGLGGEIALALTTAEVFHLLQLFWRALVVLRDGEDLVALLHVRLLPVLFASGSPRAGVCEEGAYVLARRAI